MPRYSRLGAYDEWTPPLSLVDYDVDDMVGDVHELPRGNYKPGVVLQSLIVVDRTNRRPSLDVYLFDEEPTLTSADNAPFALIASEMNKCVGIVRIHRFQYGLSVAGSSAASALNVELGIKPKGENVYAAVVAKRAIIMPFAIDALTFRYHFELERV